MVLDVTYDGPVSDLSQFSVISLFVTGIVVLLLYNSKLTKHTGGHIVINFPHMNARLGEFIFGTCQHAPQAHHLSKVSTPADFSLLSLPNASLEMINVTDTTLPKHSFTFRTANISLINCSFDLIDTVISFSSNCTYIHIENSVFQNVWQFKFIKSRVIWFLSSRLIGIVEPVLSIINAHEVRIFNSTMNHFVYISISSIQVTSL
jgi:hypothetical protein